MAAQLRMVIWQGDGYGSGKPADHSEIANRGEAIEVLEANPRDACRGMLPGDVPPGCQVQGTAREARRVASSTNGSRMHARAPWRSSPHPDQSADRVETTDSKAPEDVLAKHIPKHPGLH